MIIKNIELKNFRVYGGENFVDLSTDKNRNIVIITGANGYGKTTFLMSLVWCLYGRQMDQVDAVYSKEIDQNGGYPKYISGSLNSSAPKNETELSVSLTFADIEIPDLPECKEIKIVRSYDTRGRGKETLNIYIDGNEELFDDDNESQNKKEVFIRDIILPIEIAKFFFFDAEKIVSFAETGDTPKQVEELSRAYSQVLGIQKYDDLKRILEGLRDKYRNNLPNEKEQKQYDDLISNIKSCEDRIKILEDEIINLEREGRNKNHDLDEIIKLLFKHGDTMTQESIDELKGESKNLSDEKSSAENNLRELYKLIPFGLAGNLVTSVLARVKEERKYNQYQLQESDVEGKTKMIVRDLEREEKRLSYDIEKKICNFYKEQIKLLIKKYFSSSTEIDHECNIIHDFDESTFDDFNSMVAEIKTTEPLFNEYWDKYRRSKQNLLAIERKIKDAERKAADSATKTLREHKERLDEEKSKIEREIGEKQEKVRRERETLTAQRKQRGDLLKKIDVPEEDKLADKELEQIIINIDNFLRELKREKRKTSQDKLKDKLDILFHKKDLFDSVDVEFPTGSGNFVDFVLLKSGKRVPKTSLSMGERQMFASALLAALVEETKIDFPVFIDSPMQKFDTTHKRNALEKFYPNVSKQVVLFPLLGEELTEEGYRLIYNRVSKAYLIRHQEESSSFVQVNPSNLFKK